MPREKEGYREHYEEIKGQFGNAQLLPIKKAAEYCGIDVRALMKDTSFPLKKVAGRYYVTAVNLARWLS